MNNLGKQFLKWTTMIALSIGSTVVITIAARMTWEVVRFHLGTMRLDPSP